jgi:nicotinamide riboside kinase
MAIITISGSQGQGKTTVLASLAEMGYSVIPHKTSRAILNEWGYTLNEVNKDLELTKKFQEEILHRHHQNSIEAYESDDVYFSERSYADIFTYTLFALGSFNEYSVWLNEYYENCKEGQKIYSKVIKLGGRLVDIDDDGIRSVNEHFTNAIDLVLNYYLNDFNVPIVNIDTPDHDKRIELILENI